MSKGAHLRRLAPRSSLVPDIRRWARANAGVGVVLVAMAGIEWFSLRHGTLGLLAGAAAGVVAIVLVVTSFDLIALALGTSLIASFTLSWNGFFVGPVRPGDVLALLAVLLFVLGNDGKHIPRIPLWMWQVVVGIVLVVALNLIFPPSDRFIAGRTIIQLHNNTAVSLKSGFVTANLFTGIKFIIAVAAVPAMLAFAVLYARHYARRLIVLFAVGAALSGWVAILAKYGLNTINLFIGTHGGHGTRQIGLANQPNYLAAGVVIAVPIGMWLLFEADRTSRLLGAFTVSGCVLGAYASGSRGGSVTIVGAVGLSMLLIPRARKFVLALDPRRGRGDSWRCSSSSRRRSRGSERPPGCSATRPRTSPATATWVAPSSPTRRGATSTTRRSMASGYRCPSTRRPSTCRSCSPAESC